MKKTVIIFIAFFLLVGSSVYAVKKRPIDKIKYPALNKFELPEIHKAETSNGVKLRILKNNKLPLIDLDILIRGGNVYEPLAKLGIAEITAQLLRIGGAGEMKGEEVDQLLDSNGIAISIEANNNYYKVSLSCLEENFEESISILSKILLKPTFNNEKLDEIKTKSSSSIARRNDDPGYINSREFNKLIYGKDSPFAAVPEYDHIENITRDDIIKTYQTFFGPENCLVGIVGPVETEEVKSIFEKYFRNWDNKLHIPSYPKVKERKYDFKVAFAEKSTLNQSFFSIGHPGVQEDPANFSENAKIMVFNSIFFQGFSSRLVSRIRVKMGLTYGIGGGIITPFLYPGKTYVSTFTKSKSTIKAIQAIFEEMKKIKEEKVSAEELKDARDYFLNSYVFKFSSPGKILFNQLVKEFYGLPRDYEEKLVESIKGVTAEDVLDVADRYLDLERMIVFIVGNKNQVQGDLSRFGKVKTIDISIKPPTVKNKVPEATPEK